MTFSLCSRWYVVVNPWLLFKLTDDFGRQVCTIASTVVLDIGILGYSWDRHIYDVEPSILASSSNISFYHLLSLCKVLSSSDELSRFD